MVKILHLADIHLGMENYGRTDKSGINSRLLDFLKNLDYAVDYAIKNQVEFFLFAGDAFKTREPTQTQQREFAKRIKRLSRNNIQVILVIGNHDLPNAFGKADSLEIYKTLEVENVHIAKDPQFFKFRKMGEKNWQLSNDMVVSGFANECFQIAALPWISKSVLIGKKDYKDKTIEEVNNLMRNKISETIKKLARQVDPNYGSVLVAHATVAGAVFGAERKVYIGSDVIIPLMDLMQPWKYVALGHLHKFQVLSENPPVIYSGSVDRVDFSEEKEKKGFIEAKIKKDVPTKYKFIETPARKFISLTINIAENDIEPIETIKSEINKYNLKEVVVKVNIKISEDLAGLVNSQEVMKYLEDAYYVASINKEIIKNQSRSGEEIGDIESFSPLTALEKYFIIRGAKEKQLQEYKEYAKKIIIELEE